MTKNRQDYAYEDGRRAALRGETISQNEMTYKNRQHLWSVFLLGYYDQMKAKTRAERDAKENR